MSRFWHNLPQHFGAFSVDFRIFPPRFRQSPARLFPRLRGSCRPLARPSLREQGTGNKEQGTGMAAAGWNPAAGTPCMASVSGASLTTNATASQRTAIKPFAPCGACGNAAHKLPGAARAPYAAIVRAVACRREWARGMPHGASAVHASAAALCIYIHLFCIILHCRHCKAGVALL